MEELLEAMPRLLLGASKAPTPHYAQYLFSDGEKLRTCNGDVYVELDISLPFTGCINIFVLDKLLKSIDISNLEIGQDGDKLAVRAGNSHTLINISNLKWPTIPDVDIQDNILITEDMYESLKLSLQFTGDNLYSYSYIDNDHIIATDSGRIFIKKGKYGLKYPLGINKGLFSALDVGVSIGRYEHNVKVMYDDGIMISTADLIENYPKDKILDWAINYTKDTIKIGNVALLRDAVSKLSHIMFSEKVQSMFVDAGKDLLIVSAESIINGSSEVEYDLDNEVDHSFVSLNMNYVKNIPLDYDFYMKKGECDGLYLTNDESIIILMRGE